MGSMNPNQLNIIGGLVNSLGRTVNYTDIDGTIGFVKPSHMQRVERELCIKDKKTGEIISILSNGSTNRGFLNSIADKSRMVEYSWCTVIYLNAGRGEIRVRDNICDINNRWEIALSSYHH